MSNSFHIVVTIDASTEQHPENKAANFKMQLSNQLHLSEDREVAMTHTHRLPAYMAECSTESSVLPAKLSR